MKTKYLGIVIAGILTVGSFSVLAQEVNRNTQVNRLEAKKITGVYEQNAQRKVVPTTNNNEYYKVMKEMMEQQMAAGNLTQEQFEDMVNYCLERMENTNRSNSSGRNNSRSNNSRSNSRLRCH